MTTSTKTGPTPPDKGAYPAGRGHEELAKLYREMKGTVFGYLRRRLYWATTHDISDMTSEVFAVAIKVWPEIVPPNPPAWLMRVAENVLLEHYQRRRRSNDAFRVADPIGDDEPVDVMSPDPFETDSDDATGMQEEALVDEAVDRLLGPLVGKPRQAEAVRSRFAEGREVDEIAESIGANPRTFRNHSDRGIKFLRQHYGEEPSDQPGPTP